MNSQRRHNVVNELTARDTDSNSSNNFTLTYEAGDSGHGIRSYIDLVICRHRDADTAWTAASDGTLEERNYLCCRTGASLSRRW